MNSASYDSRYACAAGTSLGDRSQRLFMACDRAFVDVRLLRVTAGLRALGLDEVRELLDDLAERRWLRRHSRQPDRYRLTAQGAYEQARIRTASRYARDARDARGARGEVAHA